MGADARSRWRPEGTQVEVVDFASVPYLMAVPREDAFLVVLDPEGAPPELPLERPVELRLRFDAPERSFWAPHPSLRPFGPAHAESVLRFLRRARPERTRFFVCSPDGETRGPGLALGLADLMRLPPDRIRALETRYRRTYSRGVRRTLWEAAHPPRPVIHSPAMKAASAVLTFLTRYLSN